LDLQHKRTRSDKGSLRKVCQKKVIVLKGQLLKNKQKKNTVEQQTGI